MKFLSFKNTAKQGLKYAGSEIKKKLLKKAKQTWQNLTNLKQIVD